MALPTEGLATAVARNTLNSREARDRAEYEETLRRNNEILAARGHINPPDVKEPEPPPPRTPAQQVKFEAELAAGRAALERHAARRAAAVHVAPSPQEVAAQGSTTEVFRPQDFREYKETFKSPAQTVSKDNDRHGKPLVVQSPDGEAITAIPVPTPLAPAKPLKFSLAPDPAPARSNE